MKNIAPKLTAEQYAKNFSEIHRPFNKNGALQEANRCLFCYDSPCTKACPTHIDIPAFIKKIATGNLLGSAKTILNSNWIALTCAKACPVKVLCEGACVYNNENEKPIEIGRLQRYAIDAYFENGMPDIFERQPKKNKSVAVVGSGPAGLACSAELSLLGYDVTVFEASSVPGGLDTWGIAPYKTKREDSLKEVALVEKLGVKIKTDTLVGKDISTEKLLNSFDAVFLGIGLGESRDLNIPGENLKGVFSALNFIAKVKEEKWSNVDIGKRVVVIGAGNTAIDAATESVRLGAQEVSIVYRASKEKMRAYYFEVELAKKDGVRFYFNSIPKEILGNDFVEALKCVNSLSNDEFVIDVDTVIKAIGQNPKTDFILSIPGVELNANKLKVNPQTYQTGNEKVFAGGDAINGGKEVVNAAYDGKMAAHGIDKFLQK